jgi:hypothetical protein
MSRISPQLDINDLLAQHRGFSPYDVPRAGMNLLSTIATILDTPGAAVRGALHGQSLKDYLTGLFLDRTKRISGTQLMGGSPDEFSWSGLGAELALDPLNYFGVGLLTKGGKAASRAAKALDAVETGRKLSRLPANRIFQREADLGLQVLDDIPLKFTGDPALDAAYRTGIPEIIPRTSRGKKLADINQKSGFSKFKKADEAAGIIRIPESPMSAAGTLRPVSQEVPDTVLRGRQLMKSGEEVIDSLKSTGYDVTPLSATLEAQAKGQQRALISLDIPFTNVNVPIVQGDAVFKMLDPVANSLSKMKNSKALKPFRTRTGDKEIDYVLDLNSKIKQLGNAGTATLSKEVLRGIDEIAKEQGVKREELFDDLVNLFEQRPEALTPRIDQLREKFLELKYDKRPDVVGKVVETHRAKAEALSNAKEAYRYLERTLLEDLGGVADADLLQRIQQGNLPTQKQARALGVKNRQRLKNITELRRQQAYVNRLEKQFGTTPLSEKLIPATSKIDKSIGELRNEITELISRQQEWKAAWDAQPDVVKNFMRNNREYFDKMFDTVRQNLRHVDRADKDVVGYWARQLTPEGVELFKDPKFAKWLGQRISQLSKNYGVTPEASFLKARKIKGKLTTQINKEFVEEFPELQRIYGSDFKLFETNVVKVLSNYNRSMSREIATGQLVQDFLKLKAVKVADPKDRGIIPIQKLLQEARIKNFEDVDLSSGSVAKILKDSDFKDMGIPRDDFNRLVDVLHGIQKPDTLGNSGVIKFLDNVNGVFRRSFLAFWPGSNIRDFIDGGLRNFIAGSSLEDYQKALKMFRESAPVDPDAFTRGLDLSTWERLHADGVLNHGVTSEVYQQTHGEANRLKGLFYKISDRPLGTDKLPIGIEARQLYDNVNRLTLYNSGIRKGLSHDEAVQLVKKWHFDYTDLTAFERQVARRGILFYTFVRKNTPLMLELLVTNPRIALTYSRLMGKTNANLPRPHWMPDMVPVGDSFVGYNLSLEDLDLFAPDDQPLSRGVEKAASRLTPAFTIPYQLMSGRNLFTGRQMEGGLPSRLLQLSPGSRHAGGITRAQEQPGREAIRFLTGANVKKYEDLETLSNKSTIVQLLENAAKSGNVKKVDVFSSEDEEMKELISALQKLRQPKQ